MDRIYIQIFPNQKYVRIPFRKEQPSDTNVYGVITREEARIAGQLLNDKTASHILYDYFALSQDGHGEALSPTRIKAELGMSENAYRNAVKKLIDKGYLVKTRDGSNQYWFMRIPKEHGGDYCTKEGADIHIQVNSPEEVHTVPVEGEISIPEEVHTVPVEGERNNTNNTLYITHNNNGGEEMELFVRNIPTDMFDCTGQDLPLSCCLGEYLCMTGDEQSRYSFGNRTTEEIINQLVQESDALFGHSDIYKKEIAKLNIGHRQRGLSYINSLLRTLKYVWGRCGRRCLDVEEREVEEMFELDNKVNGDTGNIENTYLDDDNMPF